MSKAIVLKTFFHQLVEVTDQLTEMFPLDQNFKVFKTCLALLQKSNPILVISNFHKHVSTKYECQINDRDETFLTSYVPQDYGSDVMDVIDSVRPHWKKLDDGSKASLWQYLFILKELTKKYYA